MIREPGYIPGLGLGLVLAPVIDSAVPTVAVQVTGLLLILFALTIEFAEVSPDGDD